MRNWLFAQKLAALSGDKFESHRTVVRAARAYHTGVSSTHPVLRREVTPDQHKPMYKYRLDPDAEWRGRHLAQLTTHPDWSRNRVADRLGVSSGTIHRIIRHDRWIALPVQQTVAQLYGADTGEDIRQWWAVCDVVLDRMVVSSTHEAIGPAERAKDKQRGKDTCRGVIVRGTGTPPEVGLRVRRDRLEEVGVKS